MIEISPGAKFIIVPISDRESNESMKFSTLEPKKKKSFQKELNFEFLKKINKFNKNLLINFHSFFCPTDFVRFGSFDSLEAVDEFFSP